MGKVWGTGAGKGRRKGQESRKGEGAKGRKERKV